MGVGGSGCSAAFALAHHNGFEVSGCDLERDSPFLEHMMSKKVKVGHSRRHIESIDLLVYSPAIPSLDPDNDELSEATKKGIEAIPWEKFVADYLLENKFVIGVTGTHGKGTVTAMTVAILEKSGLDPSCLVGAVVIDWGKNYRVGASKYFVIELDEYKERFLSYHPNIAAITNVEFDHPEYFKDLKQLEKSFEKFTKNMKKDSVLILGSGVSLKNPNGETKIAKTIRNQNLKVFGGFNTKNASIAIAIAKELNISENKSKEALNKFSGIRRRFEFKGEEKGVLVFDDYAHHPTAVAAVLESLRGKFTDRRIWVVFQPHMYTRTKVFFDEFVQAFERSSADKIIFVDIFAAREEKNKNLSSKDLVRAIKNKETKYIPDFEYLANYLAKEASVDDIILVMGAGDIYKLPDLILEKLGNEE